MAEILLGTSGWDYPEWVGKVYPPGGASDKLRYYADLFSIVEVNSTFYRLPAPSVAASWVRRTPSRFRFAAKFPQTITHQLRLVGADEELGRFLAVLRPLREAGRFVAALLQLPPSLPFEPGTVRAFYASLPRDLPVAVEFRESSWLRPESVRPAPRVRPRARDRGWSAPSHLARDDRPVRLRPLARPRRPDMVRLHLLGEGALRLGSPGPVARGEGRDGLRLLQQPFPGGCRGELPDPFRGAGPSGSRGAPTAAVRSPTVTLPRRARR